MLPEQIKTVKNFHSATLKEKGSEFLAIVYPVSSEESASDHLIKIKKEYYNATHHCYAYKLKSGEVKYSDDGEPNGTAGIRILNAIKHFDLDDVLTVVVRYFGGTKLGVGPLGKAYYNASVDVLGASEIMSQTLYQKLMIKTDFSNINNVHHVIYHYSAMVADSEYSNNIKFYCWIKPKDFDKINSELTNLTNGQIFTKLFSDIKYL